MENLEFLRCHYGMQMRYCEREVFLRVAAAAAEKYGKFSICRQ